ncbi:Golgi-associated plant pathoproteinsis-related protein 1 [Porites harrisoni]
MSFKDQCIYWHNYFRTLHQVSNVTWSTSLQKEAEDWVKYLAENNKFHHSQKNPGNLYLSHPNDYPAEYCSDAIQWFHWEEKYYNYSRPGYSQAAGHFTTVVWRNSREIGAAWAIRKDKRLVISIKYHPGGNYVGYFKNNVFRPIATVLGPEWPHHPPRFTRCPAKFVQQTTTAVPTTTPTSVPNTTQITLPNTTQITVPNTTQITVPTTSPSKVPFKDQCLFWHNYFRTLHQVPTVTWSKRLQKEAEDLLKNVTENGGIEKSRDYPGKLYLSPYETYPVEYCSTATWWFHHEEQYYNYSNPGFVKKAETFTQLIWKKTTQIGAAWTLLQDKRLAIFIKYYPEGNIAGYFGRNVFRPTARKLGSELGRVPPEFTWCPADAVQRKPPVKAAVTKLLSNVQLFIWALPLAWLTVVIFL